MQDNIALFASTTTFLETSSLLSKKNIPKMMTLTMDAFSLHIFFYFMPSIWAGRSKGGAGQIGS